MAGAGGHATYTILSADPAVPQTWPALAPTPVEVGFTQAGAWLQANAPPGAQVGAAQIGVLGYVSDLPLLDYRGSLQPEIEQAQARGDGLWWIDEYQPDYLVLRASLIDALKAEGLADDPWFGATYAEAIRFPVAEGSADPLVILAREATSPPLAPQFTGMVALNDQLVVNGIATDFSLTPLDMNRMGRVRVEWLLNAPVSAPLYTAILVESRDGSVAALGGTRQLHFERWPTRHLITTYYTIQLAPSLPPGVYDISVGTGPDPFTLTWTPVAQAKVPFPTSEFVGAVSGTRAEFGDIALLGYRLARNADQLEVVLMWQAIRAPHANYRVFIQVRSQQGAILAHQEVEPHGGGYPTSIWSAGERVPDTYDLDISQLPPGDYAVFVGLLNPDGSRMITTGGQDAVEVGRVTLGG